MQLMQFILLQYPTSASKLHVHSSVRLKTGSVSQVTSPSNSSTVQEFQELKSNFKDVCTLFFTTVKALQPHSIFVPSLLLLCPPVASGATGAGPQRAAASWPSSEPSTWSLSTSPT